MLTQNVHGGSVFMESRHNWSCIAGFSRMVGGVIEPWIKNVPSEPPSSALGGKVEDNIESYITSYFCNFSLQKILVGFIYIFWFIIWVTILVPNRARSELTRSKCKWNRKWKGKGVDKSPKCLLHSRRKWYYIQTHKPSWKCQKKTYKLTKID